MFKNNQNYKTNYQLSINFKIIASMEVQDVISISDAIIFVYIHSC